MASPFNASEIPGMASMNDSLSFVKNLWGGMHIPGMVTPTVSIDDLDKKIKDLKTVESWLTVNMNMLRGTIQALEVQRATIAALNSLSESFASTMSAATAPAEPESAKSADSPLSDYWSKAAFNNPFSTSTAESSKETAAESVVAPPEPEPRQEPAAEPKEPVVSATAKNASPEPASTADAPNAFNSPAAWWNLLQDQFKQAVSKAMASEPADATSAMTPVKKTGKKAIPPATKTVGQKVAVTKLTKTAKSVGAASKLASAAVIKKVSSRTPAKTGAVKKVGPKKVTTSGIKKRS